MKNSRITSEDYGLLLTVLLVAAILFALSNVTAPDTENPASCSTCGKEVSNDSRNLNPASN